MSYTSGSNVLDSLLDPFTECLDTVSARRVAELRISPKVQDRVDALAERSNQGLLTEGERGEYEAFVNASDIIAILKLKAMRNLESRPGA